MLNLFLFAGQAQGQMFNTAGPATAPPYVPPDFDVISCNRQLDNEPEMTLAVSQSYFEENLRDIYGEDEFTFTTDLREETPFGPTAVGYNGYVKTVPEDELLVDFDDECMYCHWPLHRLGGATLD